MLQKFCLINATYVVPLEAAFKVKLALIKTRVCHNSVKLMVRKGAFLLASPIVPFFMFDLKNKDVIIEDLTTQMYIEAPTYK